VTTLWTPPKQWEGQDAFLIGGGPSLTAFDFSRLRGRNVIGCNDAVFLGPEINSYVIFGDPSWWQKNRHTLEHYTGHLVTNCPGVLHFNIPNLFKMTRERDGIHSGTVLGWNYSTGAAAINLAVSLGAMRIFLLGYDLGNKGTTSHWHKHNGKTTQEYAFQRFMRGFAMIKTCLPKNVKVLNVTDGTSRLDCFERMPFEMLESVLNKNEEVAA